MKGRSLLVVVGAVTALAVGLPRAHAQSVQRCPDPANCAEVTIGSGSAKVNETVSVGLTFKQGPDNAQAGGVDEVAALALTLRLGDGTGTPLVLADCALNADGLPNAVHPDASIANFKVVVENASCANGRTHCLCPDPGTITADNFLNLVIYGPNPLPPPGPSPIEIPTLPAGPGSLLTIDLKGSAAGAFPLHVLRESVDASRPQFMAFLSVGDKTAVDQTCVPVSGQPPCSTVDAVSQVEITDGSVTLTALPAACVGDCSGDNEVTVDELLKMVNIALETLPLSDCPVGDADGSGDITVNEIIQAVNFALTMCPLT